MKELRVYLVDIGQIDEYKDGVGADIDNVASLSDNEFMELSEQQELVYTLTNFANVFNFGEEIDSYNQYIRFIEVEV